MWTPTGGTNYFEARYQTNAFLFKELSGPNDIDSVPVLMVGRYNDYYWSYQNNTLAQWYRLPDENRYQHGGNIVGDYHNSLIRFLLAYSMGLGDMIPGSLKWSGNEYIMLKENMNKGTLTNEGTLIISNGYPLQVIGSSFAHAYGGRGKLKKIRMAINYDFLEKKGLPPFLPSKITQSFLPHTNTAYEISLIKLRLSDRNTPLAKDFFTYDKYLDQDDINRYIYYTNKAEFVKVGNVLRPIMRRPDISEMERLRKRE